MKTKMLLTFVIVCLAYFFYKRNVNTSPSPPSDIVNITNTEPQFPDGFKAFYDSFHRDSVLQMESIIWPLRRITDDTLQLDDWMPDTWRMHGPYDSKGGTFTRSFEVVDRLVIEHISDASETYTMERRWAMISDGWRLVYYRPMGAYGQ